MLTDQPISFSLRPSLSTAPPIAQSDRTVAGKPFIILIIISALMMAGIGWGLWLRTFQLGQPDPDDWYNVFYVLFGRNEPAALTIVIVFSLVAAFALCRNKRGIEEGSTFVVRHERLLLVAVAVLVFATTALGTQVVTHGYALTADENLADFQAKIFLHGKTRAEVLAPWTEVVGVIRPTFISYFPATHSWNASYLPVYAAMRALFQSVQLQSLLNPFLAAITVLVLYGVARNIWPTVSGNAWIAVALLVSSTQFLLMSMTSYAMPAHLALNTIWLWLYLRPDRRSFYMAPFIGVLAIGLHQPIVHALFVLPFLLRLVLQRKWRIVLGFGIVYLAGCALWLLWKTHYESGGSGVGSIFNFRNPRMAIIQSMNVLLVISWVSLATPLLAILGFSKVFRLSPFLRDAALSCLLTFGFYFFFYADQAHGWGYRYFYGELSCFVLVAVAGCNSLSQTIGHYRARMFLSIGIALSLLIQLPLRCFQVESFIRPYARTAALLHAIPADVVAFDPRDAWYSADLVRNDPFLEQRPVIVSLMRLTQPQVEVLKSAGTVRFIDRQMLTQLGLATKQFDRYPRGPFGLWDAP